MSDRTQLSRRACRDMGVLLAQAMAESDTSFSLIEVRTGRKTGWAKDFLISLLEGEDTDLNTISDAMFACGGAMINFSVRPAPKTEDSKP